MSAKMSLFFLNCWGRWCYFLLPCLVWNLISVWLVSARAVLKCTAYPPTPSTLLVLWGWADLATRISACDFNPFCTLCTPRGSIWHVANVSATELSMLGQLVTDIKICTQGCSLIQNCGPDGPHNGLYVVSILEEKFQTFIFIFDR